jgi:hypothetical protein
VAASSSDELLGKARELEAEAVRTGEDLPKGRELRAEAAKLRCRALGAKVYPVLTCSSCYRITGWTAADGRCDACLRRAQLESAYADPHGGWVAVTDTREPPPKQPAPPLRARIAALAGGRAARERAVALEWLKRVDPDTTGPISPEAGYELEVARRDEVDAADGSGIVIRFSTATLRFADSGWLQLETSRIGHADMLIPAEFSAGLPMAQLAEAWTDYELSVALFNRAIWQGQSAAREVERQTREDREEALRQQRHVSELLDDGS